jgi:uncharacterized protein (DUF1501 family)
MNPQALIAGERSTAGTVVVVFLRGAADGLALVAPWSDPHYARARPRLRAPEQAELRLDDRFALHPRLAPLLGAWREGELAVVHACGMAEDTRSHFEAQDLMEHGGVTAGGGRGRFRRTRPAAAHGGLAGVAIGRALPECLLGAPGAAVLERLEDFALGGAQPVWRSQLERLYAKVRESAGDEDAGMLSASVDFGKSSRRAAGGAAAAAAADDDDNRRKTSFGMIVWAMFRQGVLRTGLFDENFYPG